MKNRLFCRAAIIMFCVFFVIYHAQPSGLDFESFAQSFIKHYEFNAEGRYVHEYHPFLLEHTASSFGTLEQRLQDAGMTLSGRYLILGYEENAVPGYYTHYKEARISDEMSIKNRSGWSLRLHNRFGFMTGFLLRNVNKIQDYSSQDYSSQQFFDHLDVSTIRLFDARAGIFQEHAFGEALPLMLKTQKAVEQCIVDGDVYKAFGVIGTFWDALYQRSFKVGNQQIAGTQDILFSIAYLEYLLSSPTPLKQCFVGPDITYPIEIFAKQDKIVTRHAQKFVKQFARLLQPVDQKPTVYVFDSFVDGVGKSTMLGNIKNWMKFGDQVELFDHVDNSSSQLADIFQFSDDVFIADLPAQMSHFTYKPDGFVYVDALTECTEEELASVTEFVQEHYKALMSQYQALLRDVQSIISYDGFLATSCCDSKNPQYTFIRNLLLLKKEKNNRWIPFLHEGKEYLFDRYNPANLNILVSLSNVKSEGLKNIQSEQMLFYEGLRFPLPYDHFVADVVEKFQDHGIERIVFIDFLSMYPRSCRENIRVNYLLQQCALLDEKFNVTNSLYRDFVNEAELLHALCDQQSLQSITSALHLETIVRMLLHMFIIDRQYGDLEGLSIADLTERLAQSYHELPSDVRNKIHRIAVKKVNYEKDKMERLYGMGKSFINLQNTSLSDIVQLSGLIQYVMGDLLKHERLNRLWKPLDAVLYEEEEKLQDGFVDRPVKLTSGSLEHAYFKASLESKDEGITAPIHQLVRMSWYIALANLVFSDDQSDKGLTLQEELFRIPPLFLQGTFSGNLFALQPTFKSFEGEWPPYLDHLFAVFSIARRSVYIGLYDELPYCLEWDHQPTNYHMFGYGCHRNLKEKEQQYGLPIGDVPIISNLVRQHQDTHGQSVTIATSDLYQQLRRCDRWNSYHQNLIAQTKKSGLMPSNCTMNDLLINISWQPDGPSHTYARCSRKIYQGRSGQRQGSRLFIRLIATLDMLLKDPDGHIVIRRGNRDDFQAAVWMLEKITLPNYLGVYFQQDLFDDYAAVEPYPSWEFWDKQHGTHEIHMP